jgi:hypothetical protein
MCKLPLTDSSKLMVLLPKFIGFNYGKLENRYERVPF